MVSSRACFCWLYRTSPSSVARSIINLIPILTIWWYSCVVISYIVGKGCLLWPIYSLDQTLLVFALLHFVLQGQTCLLLHVSLDFLLLRCNPLWWKGHLFLVLVLENLEGLHRTIQLSFFSISRWGIIVDYCDFEWFALEMNRGHSHFWDCTQVLHFGLFRWLWELLYFF